jgi:hypothetical protein
MGMMPGALRFQDGTIKWYEYNSVGDNCMTGLFDSIKDVRQCMGDQCYKTCSCDRPKEPVEIVSFYGYGHHWKGEACRACMAITFGTDPFEAPDADLERMEVKEKLPAWAEGLYSPLGKI